VRTVFKISIINHASFKENNKCNNYEPNNKDTEQQQVCSK